MFSRIAPNFWPAQKSFNRLRELKTARARLSCSQIIAMAVYTARKTQFEGYEFWAMESANADKILDAVEKARVSVNSPQIIEKHIGRLEAMTNRLNDLLGLNALQGFEDFYDEFEEASSGAQSLLVEHGKEYSGVEKWKIEAAALRERVGDAKRFLVNGKKAYVKQYRAGRISRLSSFIQTELEELSKERERLNELVLLDVFNPLRNRSGMFGKLAREIRKAKVFIQKYNNQYIGNNYWLSESRKICLELLLDAVKNYNECRKTDLKELDPETLANMDTMLRLLAGKLSSERERLAVLIGQNYFDLIAEKSDPGHIHEDPPKTYAQDVIRQDATAETITQKVDAFESLGKELDEMFAQVEAQKRRFDELRKSSSPQKAGEGRKAQVRGLN